MIQIEYKKIRKAIVSCCFLLKKTKKQQMDIVQI